MVSEGGNSVKGPMRIRDARGRLVAQLDPVAMHLLHQHDVIEPEALRAIVEEIGPGMLRWQTRVFTTISVLCVLCLIAALVRAWGFGHGLDTVGKGLWTLNAALLGLAGAMMYRYARRMRFGRVMRVMLKHERCPHCGYDLRGSPRDEKGSVVVCAECGCAWRHVGND